MFSSPILDLALTLCFLYFTLSLIVSTVHEFIYSILINKRGDFLNKAIRQLFFDKEWNVLVQKILTNSNINALKSSIEKTPSYIPARNFANALLDQFRSGNELLDMNKIQSVLTDDSKAKATGIEGEVRNVLLNLFESAKGDLQNFQKQIETFYDDAMERAAGVYKRSTRKALLVISIIVAGALNADTLYISNTLWSNPDVLKQAADNVQNAVKHIKQDTAGNFTLDSIIVGDNQLVINSHTDSATLMKRATDSTNNIKHVQEVVKKQVLMLKKTGIPIGWTDDNIPSKKDAPWNWLIKLGGLLVTALALMLGAPFWFDMINKIINIRATGKKPNDSNATGTGNSNTFPSNA